MSNEPNRTMSHFALGAFTDAYWQADGRTRADTNRLWLRALRDAAMKVDVYQVFPAESENDVLIWSAIAADETDAAARFFDCFARALNPVRRYVRVNTTLWGFTRPS